ncbi:MAG TPA: J domain-containing protein [Chitinophagaceae bacterium]|nr:J domain-containing protein [Chitinophagaceae bacterium]
MIEAYPLQWPIGYSRTENNAKKHAQFSTAFAKARDGILRQLRAFNAKDVIISSNVPLKRDGIPYAVPYGNSKNITDDTGIAVYFTLKDDQKVICCDAFHTLDDNIHAINLSLEALRGLDRWKCSDIVNQAFTGFKALPEVSSSNIWETLELPGQPDNSAIIRANYKKIAKRIHPDVPGGSSEAFAQLLEAYRQALQIFNEKP